MSPPFSSAVRFKQTPAQHCENYQCSTLFRQTMLNRLITEHQGTLGNWIVGWSPFPAFQVYEKSSSWDEGQRRQDWVLASSFKYFSFYFRQEQSTLSIKTLPTRRENWHLVEAAINVCRKSAFHHLPLIASMWSASRQMLHGNSLTPVTNHTPPL